MRLREPGAGDVAGGVTGQEHLSGRELSRLTGATEQGVVAEAATFSGGMVAGITGVQIGPRRHAVDPDSLVSEQLSQAGAEVRDRDLDIAARIGTSQMQVSRLLARLFSAAAP